MALEVYTVALCLVDGSLLTQEAQVTINRDSRAQEVNTVAKGFGGLSPGAAIMHIDVENAVPSSDFEINPGKYFVKFLKVVEVTFFAAGRTLTAKGFIPKDDFRHGVNQESKLSFHIVSEIADWV